MNSVLEVKSEFGGQIEELVNVSEEPHVFGVSCLIVAGFNNRIISNLRWLIRAISHKSHHHSNLPENLIISFLKSDQNIACHNSVRVKGCQHSC